VPRLSEADYRSILEVLERAAEVEEMIPFPPPVLDALRHLVPCDVVTYHEEREQRLLVYTGEPVGPMTKEIRRAATRYAHQDPLVPAAGARTISDRIRKRDYQRLELYQEADRPLGIEHMMRLWLEPTGTDAARLEFDRSEKDFSERDRTVLDLVLPQLRQFRLRAIARRGAQSRAPESLKRLTAREREILGHVAEGKSNGEVARLLGISSGTVRKHLENAYAKLEVHTRTAAVAALNGLNCDGDRTVR
jgi:DNA-binding CsgD family transcriptional regulator